MTVFKYEEEFPLLSSSRGNLAIKQLLSRPLLQQHVQISVLKKPSDMSEQVRSSDASQVSVHGRPLGKTYKGNIYTHKKDSTPLTSPLVHNGSISCKQSVYTGKQVSNNTSQYMYEQGTFDKILTTGDVICKKCLSILYRYTGQQQHDKKVECVSPREYISLILKQAVSGTLDIDIPDINKLALTELIKFVCTELMQNKALLLSEMVYKFQEFGGCFSSSLRQNQTRFILDKLQFIFSSNIDTDKIDKIGTK
ncbi:unnamed protein product [Mytilus coruscus]|uniref:Uncharacterized protein n=1 Tax=Mytilus coruscus TaxID=42192 RepID=A0A6J8CTV6_MYTCO|nr:unnamed protein product [Mytilus coruscus]